MPLPIYTNIEIPVLHELCAVGGNDDVRYLYERLISYFPELTENEIRQIKSGKNENWRKVVQRAGKSLDKQNLIRRKRGFWSLTDIGKKVIAEETSGIVITKIANEPVSHQDIQQILCEIGGFLGFYSETEFEFYDVIWRESKKSPRISHVFEVQSKGNIDSAFAKLKRAFDAQRSKPFLILSSERDTKRAENSLNREFRELENVLEILSFAEIRKIHTNLAEISAFLPNFLDS